VPLAVDQVVVNLGVKGLLDLSSCTGELNRDPALVDLIDLEAVVLQPTADRRNIAVGGTLKPS